MASTVDRSRSSTRADGAGFVADIVRRSDEEIVLDDFARGDTSASAAFAAYRRYTAAIADWPRAAPRCLGRVE